MPQQVTVAQDDRQQVVEVVGDARRQPAECLKLLRVLTPLFQELPAITLGADLFFCPAQLRG